LSLARNAERMHELKRLASMARCFDVDVEVITPAEAGRRWPLMRTDDLVGALWLPRDGRTNPIDTTLALAKGARLGGATVLENVAVTGIRVHNGRVAGVTTSHGEVACEAVVNCAGMWARDVGRMAGVTVPAARLRALLHRDRADGRRGAGPAGAARHRRLHLRA
jgi:4-methylaminobutanoate oxidase (formaldehyde-forming)